MENEIEIFISKRCESELLNSKEYIELQEKLIKARKDNDFDLYSDLTISIQIIVEQVVYKTGVKDTIKMIT